MKLVSILNINMYIYVHKYWVTRKMHLTVGCDQKSLKATVPEHKKLASQKGEKYLLQTTYEKTFTVFGGSLNYSSLNARL